METREAVPGGPGYVMVSPFSMTPRYSETEFAFEGSALVSFCSSGCYFNFPVNIPHGAIITKLVAYFVDHDASKNMLVNLYRDNYDNLTRTLMGQAVSFGSAGYIYATDSSIDYASVDLSSYSYSLELYIPEYISGSGFMGARVDYSYPAFVPMVNN